MPRVPLAAGLLVVALLALSLATNGHETPPARHAPTAHPAMRTVRPPAPPTDAAIVGDSYTAGARASSPRRGYAELVSGAMGWQHPAIYGLSGAGYARPSVHGRRLTSVIPKVVARRPPVLLVVLGHNDTRVAPERVRAAARLCLWRLRRRLREATIVVVGPIWPSGSPPYRVLVTRDAILRAVRDVDGLKWIDPVAERWFTGDRARHTGNAARFISADENHPNNAGHAHIARLLVRDLRRLAVPAGQALDGS